MQCHGLYRRLSTGLVAAALALLAGCSSLAPAPGLRGIDGSACVGSVLPVPAGLQAVDDAPLLASALGAAEQGKLCAGQVLQALQPVTVYRVWDAAVPYTALGGWWSLEPPQGPRQAYRERNAICAAWSALDRVSQCSIKPGSRLVLGPGQSARCDEGVLPASAVNQVYLPNDTLAGVVLVDNCSEGQPWPAP